MAARKNDRIFNRDGLRHYRRTYSMAEVRVGVVILGVLACIALWIVWRGDHPADPDLFSTDPSLLSTGQDSIPERARVTATSSSSTPGHTKPDDSTAEHGGEERGPVPGDLAAPGFTETSLSSFGPDNLYEKIDGREGYYKSFGFQKLYFVALVSDTDETAAVDIEIYDLGTMGNALGAYAGELQPEARPELSDGGMGHTARNAMFLVRGKYYVRSVGSDETDVIKAQLEHIRTALYASLPGEPLPWGYAVFAGQMGVQPGKIGFVTENAYSFGFASNVFNARIDDEGAEMFMVATPSDKDAASLARAFAEGFESYGEIDERRDGALWIKDRYLGNLSGAAAVGPLVIGVYSAADIDAATSAFTRLRTTVESLSPDVLERAVAQANESARQTETPASGSSYDGHGNL